MRWHLIDKFFDIEPHVSLKARKLISHNERFMEETEDSELGFPASLLIEMMAQAGGVLAGISQGFQKEVILGKIEFASFSREILPPDEVVIEAKLISEDSTAAWTEIQLSVESKEAAKSKIMFVYLDSFQGSGKGTVFNERFLKSYGLSEYQKEYV